MKTCGLRNVFLWLFFSGLVLCPNARKRSRGPDDGPSQPTQIPRHRHPVQLARLRRALPVSAGLSHELRPPLWGVVGLAPTKHQLAYTDQPGQKKKTHAERTVWALSQALFFNLCAKVIWGVGPNAGGWGERLPTLMFSNVRIDRYQIFLCRHISPRGLALFICLLNSMDINGPRPNAYMCDSARFIPWLLVFGFGRYDHCDATGNVCLRDLTGNVWLHLWWLHREIHVIMVTSQEVMNDIYGTTSPPPTGKEESIFPNCDFIETPSNDRESHCLFIPPVYHV